MWAMLTAPVLVFPFEIERPSWSVSYIGRRSENSFGNDEAAVGIGVHIGEYKENPDPVIGPFFGRDGFALRVVCTANTREGIEYSPEPLDTLYDDTFSPPFYEHQLNLGDDDGAWVNLPFQVAFYTSQGGLQSQSLYSKVWICSNGFLCFDNNSTSPNPKYGPEAPNTIMAPYWSDLDPSGGIISYKVDLYSFAPKFIVSWYNVLDKKNGIRQTFEVIIRKSSEGGAPPRFPNMFIFQYRDVTWSYEAQFIIENQVGSKHNRGILEPSIKSLLFYPPASPTPAIQSLSIKLEKQDSTAEIFIGTQYWELSGVNLKTETMVPIGEPWYETALKGCRTLLLSYLLSTITGSGILLAIGTDIFVVGLETVATYSAAMVPVSTVNKKDANETENLAYVSVPAAGDDHSDWPVDASLGAQIYWVFNDNNTLDHSLKITAELTYFSYKTWQNETITTSVNLNVPCDAGNDIATSRKVSSGEYLAYLDHDYDKDDYYNISVSYGQYVEIIMHPPNDANFDLYLYNKQGTIVAQSKRSGNQFEDITYRALYTGPYYIRVNAPLGGVRGFYTLKFLIFLLEVVLLSVFGMEHNTWLTTTLCPLPN